MKCSLPICKPSCPVQQTKRLPVEEKIAKEFHYAYEWLAPIYGYKTRDETAVAWANVPEANRRLMVAVVRTLIDNKVITPGRRWWWWPK